VLASAGYPDAASKPVPILGLDPAGQAAGALVFHAGTARDSGGWLAAGGRVLGVTGLGRTAEASRRAAYSAAARIQFEGRRMRSDIGDGRKVAS
jgi:phosphoribosylamine--glycine ligase